MQQKNQKGNKILRTLGRAGLTIGVCVALLAGCTDEPTSKERDKVAMGGVVTAAASAFLLAIAERREDQK